MRVDGLARLASRASLAAAMMLTASLLASGCGDESDRTPGTARVPTAKEKADAIAWDIGETERNIADAKDKLPFWQGEKSKMVKVCSHLPNKPESDWTYEEKSNFDALQSAEYNIKVCNHIMATDGDRLTELRGNLAAAQADAAKEAAKAAADASKSASRPPMPAMQTVRPPAGGCGPRR